MRRKGGEREGRREGGWGIRQRDREGWRVWGRDRRGGVREE